MFTLLKNAECYGPAAYGKLDILIAYGTLCRMESHISAEGLWNVREYDCSDRIICPAFIDQHVHITGGGGEEGPASRIPELMCGDIAEAGVATIVGVLGVDGVTRSIAALLAKANALQWEGINSYIYTGSYGVPTETLTGKVMTDLALIDKVIGTGEIAISDERSSHPSIELLRSLAYETRVGGMVGGKAGVMHIHVGEGKRGLAPLLELIDSSDFPVRMFVPTHINRTRKLFEEGLDFLARGGNIDLTAGEASEKGYSVPDALDMIINGGMPIDRVTVTSDGNGSIPSGQGSERGVGKVRQLFEDIRTAIADRHLSIEPVLRTVTENPARVLGLYPRKGILQPGCDADILVLHKGDFSLDKLFIRGSLFVDNGQVVKRGKYEKMEK